jgi:asparagine synthase (glutamine-hydrolysing)
VAAGGAQTRPRKQDIQSLLEEAIRSHLVSDVPIATLLSGGLDSSVIAAESARAGERTKCFTAQIPGELYDESSYAREVAASYRLEHRIVSIPELRDFAEVQSLIRIKDQPLGMHNEVAIYKLAQAVAKEAKVVLCGEGADEIFWGYGRIFRLPFDFARRRLFESLGPLIGPHLFKKAEISEDECGLSQVETFIYRYAYFPERLLATLLRPEWRAAFTRDSEHRAIVQEEFETSRHLSFADGLSLFFICHHLPGLLGMIDAMTMAASLEARVPFTDHRLIEAVFRLHPREKIRWRSPVHFLAATFLPVAKFSESCDVTKYALRNTYARYLPPITVNRRKMAFPTPLTESLGRPGSLAYRLLVTPNARITEWFDARAVARWFETGATLPTESFGRQLWMLLNLELFLTEYFAT